jgi:hypothetical protein
MTSRIAAAKTSKHLPGPRRRGDCERDPREAVIDEAGATGDNGRDLVHGEGGTIDIRAKPGDLAKDG